MKPETFPAEAYRNSSWISYDWWTFLFFNCDILGTSVTQNQMVWQL
jgi:hypothetical protein